MRVTVHQAIRYRYILLVCITIVLFSCSTTRRMERKESREVYSLLGLNKDGKDNFALYREAASWLHVPHVDGGMSRNGTDCSFLVYTIYKTVYRKTVERNSTAMLNKNCQRISRNELKEGDLVFFNTSVKSKSRTYVNHVGLYLKDHKFLHSSTSKGVIVSDLDEGYFRKTWVCGGRVK
ncbi:MAG: C40 family peptidase [Bacteroidota bacterium]|nr:C40 family peptidase [Bacteroidota bacterium]